MLIHMLEQHHQYDTLEVDTIKVYIIVPLQILTQDRAILDYPHIYSHILAQLVSYY